MTVIHLNVTMLLALYDLEIMALSPTSWSVLDTFNSALVPALREFGKRYKNTTTPLGGTGELSDKVLNAMQNYFGLAIHQTKGQLYEKGSQWFKFHGINLTWWRLLAFFQVSR